jgi:murein DD-endopeptidase MepM/ murein hydrolase activator NlpD
MRHTTYRYNTETCQYERVKVNAKNVIWYCLGVSATGAAMLFGLLLLHDLVVNTETEKKLRKENRAFKEHHSILSSHLDELQPELTALQNKDQLLHFKFFGSQPTLPADNTISTSKEKLLLADAGSFRKMLISFKKETQALINESSTTNRYFGNALKIEKKEMGLIGSLPTLQPFESWKSEMVISGFGLRVNPFHKGLYEHIGIDIAMPRGTAVIATAAGVIVELKRSDLQAGYGNYIEIDHGHGLVTRYAHLQDIQVSYGKKIPKGAVIGTVGTSGGSIAPHLHYEILRDGKNVDPTQYMMEGLTSDEHDQLAFMSHQQNQSLD